jgi:hypothetical protein
MGNCLRNEKEQISTSLLADLNDSRHVMMKRSSKRGAKMKDDGSFYRPRQDIPLFSAISPPLSQIMVELTNETRLEEFKAENLGGDDDLQRISDDVSSFDSG